MQLQRATLMQGALKHRWNIGLGENQPDLAQLLSVLVGMQPDMHCAGTAPTCSAVLQLARRAAIDGWLLDLALDDGSSLPAIATLRAANPQAAIVVMTGLSSTAIDEHCRAAGADAVLTKDGQVLLLLDALRHCLAQRNSRTRGV